jgi:hypothetical protein
MPKTFIKKALTLTFLSSFLFVLFLIIPSPVHAQTSAWSGVCVASEDPGNAAYQVATIQGLQCVVANILSIAVTLIGLAGFIMLIVGAFRFLLSGGNSKGIEDGRKTLTFAFSGLILAVSAIIILNLIANFTGVKAILGFTITSSQDKF